MTQEITDQPQVEAYLQAGRETAEAAGLELTSEVGNGSAFSISLRAA